MDPSSQPTAMLSSKPDWIVHCRQVPFAHQVTGVERLVQQPVFLLADEMGAGKTRQVIDAAQILFRRGTIGQVVVIAPAAVRSVWFDQQFGELAKHLWYEVPSVVTEYHAKLRTWRWGEQDKEHALRWLITNYDFIRSDERISELLDFVASKPTLLVLDESSAVKNWKAKQTKACLKIRKACARVVLLNGTPIANNPLDMFSQGRLMNPAILGCTTYFHARARYAIVTVQAGFPKIIGWQNLDDMQRRFAPYVLRRLKKDCLDLPEKMPPVILTATLKPEAWKLYKEMRDELCIWLTDNSVSTAAQAAVKVMRLAQITSGFVGGVEDALADLVENTDTEALGALPEHTIGHEKVDVILDWLTTAFAEDPNLKVLIWTRFRHELAELVRAFHTTFPGVALGQIHGMQRPTDREAALRLLNRDTAPEGPAIVVGITQVGEMGLNLTAAHHVIYASNSFSLKTRLQSEDRVHRPGQTHAVNYYDVVAVGPNGQRTIDHVIQAVLRGKLDIATWTSSAWVTALKSEEFEGIGPQSGA
jgi:SNF2 family DNA or RNA helicase